MVCNQDASFEIGRIGQSAGSDSTPQGKTHQGTSHDGILLLQKSAEGTWPAMPKGECAAAREGMTRNTAHKVLLLLLDHH